MKNPMLAANAADITLRFPLLASPKLDGIRCLVGGGVALTRSLKPIPNDYIRGLLSMPALEGFDGELVVGSPTAKDCYRTTSSGVMSHDGVPEFTYLVFDFWNHGGVDFAARYDLLKLAVAKFAQTDVLRRHLSVRDSATVSILGGRVVVVPHALIRDASELETFEARCLEEGYEGVITRDPRGFYKHGRSTAREQGMLKIKRFEDGEAEVLAVEELLHNDNAATTNALGHTERSSHRGNLRSGGTMGALLCRDLKTGAEFSIGTGFDAAGRAFIWAGRAAWVGIIVKYKYFTVGMKGDVPRHPIYLGTRDRRDLSSKPFGPQKEWTVVDQAR